MKTRTYCIATAGYDTRLIAFVTGPARPALSTLLKQFKALYDTTPRLNERIPTGEGILMRVTAEVDREQRARDAGYVGTCWAELFVDWLKRKHGYVDVEVGEVYL